MLGVSTDTVESHLKFARKYSLPFPLLSDVGGKISQAYGVAKLTSKGEVRARRVSFIIDQDGKIEKLWDPVKADEHNEQVLTYLRERETAQAM